MNDKLIFYAYFGVLGDALSASRRCSSIGKERETIPGASWTV